MLIEVMRMTLEAYLHEWVLLRSVGLRPRTIECYTTLIRLYIAPAIGDRKLDKLKAKHIARMLSGIMATGHTRTAELCFVVLRAALRSAVQTRRLKWSPMDAVTRPKHIPAEGRAWTKEQTRTYVAAIRGHKHELAWLLAVGMGLRRGEICGLRWSDVDLRARVLHIRYQRQRLADGRLVDAPPKSRAGTRDLPIPAVVYDALRRKYQWGDAFVVPITPSGLDAAHRALLRRLDLPYIRLHDLRHTMATNAARNGALTRVLASVLGHSDPALTARCYTHVDDEMVGQALDAAARSMVY